MLGIRDAGSRFWGQFTLLEIVIEDPSFVWVSSIHRVLMNFFSLKTTLLSRRVEKYVNYRS